MRSYSRVCLVYYCLFFVFYFFWYYLFFFFFFFSSRRRHTRSLCDWSSDVCSSDLRCAPSSAGDGTARSSPTTTTASASPWRTRRSGRAAGGAPPVDHSAALARADRSAAARKSVQR